MECLIGAAVPRATGQFAAGMHAASTAAAIISMPQVESPSKVAGFICVYMHAHSCIVYMYEKLIECPCTSMMYCIHYVYKSVTMPVSMISKLATFPLTGPVGWQLLLLLTLPALPSDLLSPCPPAGPAPCIYKFRTYLSVIYVSLWLDDLDPQGVRLVY